MTRSSNHGGVSLMRTFLVGCLVLLVFTLTQFFFKANRNALLSQEQLSVMDTVFLFEAAPKSMSAQPASLHQSRLSSVVNHTKIHQYKILGFSDEAYIDQAIRWHRELIDLGYPSSHVVVGAMTHNTLRRLQQANITTQLCTISGSPLEQRRPLNRRRAMFATRWKCVLKELQNGTSVLLTDVDNHFTKYIPIDDATIFNPQQWNVMHSYSNGYPTRFQKAHGFTVCGCLTWLQAHPATLRYIQLLLESCGDECDDQVAMNALWPKLDMEWNITTSAMENNYTETSVLYDDDKKNSTSNTNWKDPILPRSGISRVTGHRVYIWGREFAYRGPLNAQPCPRRSMNWVTMPTKIHQRPEQLVSLWNHHCPAFQSTHGSASFIKNYDS